MVCSCMSPSLCVYCGISLTASLVAVLISSFVSSNALLTACCWSFCICDGDGTVVSSSLRSFLLIDIIVYAALILYKTMVYVTFGYHIQPHDMHKQCSVRSSSELDFVGCRNMVMDTFYHQSLYIIECNTKACPIKIATPRQRRPIVLITYLIQ